jgi:hypothetical protein
LNSAAHRKTVQYNQHFGAGDSSSPRPFKCTDCDIAFRAHGFLARHLRSIQHLLQLENLCKVPLGTSAILQNDLKELDTLDAERNLESILNLLQQNLDKGEVTQQEVVIEDGPVLSPKEQFVVVDEVVVANQ